MDLCDVVPGCDVRVSALRSSAEVIRRLDALGVSIGARMSVIRRRGGDVIVMACGVRYAIGRDIARSIAVAEDDA